MEEFFSPDQLYLARECTKDNLELLVDMAKLLQSVSLFASLHFWGECRLDYTVVVISLFKLIRSISRWVGVTSFSSFSVIPGSRILQHVLFIAFNLCILLCLKKHICFFEQVKHYC